MDAYTVHTWTLKMDDDDGTATWVMDGVLDAAQLWDLDGYRGLRLPRLELDYPVVNMDDPHVICFTMCEAIHEDGGDRTVWRIMVDMRSKTLQSAICYPETWSRLLIPSRVSNYFNSSIAIPSSSSEPGPALAELNLTSNKRIKLETSNTVEPAVEPPCESSAEPMQAAIQTAASPEATILAALQEIPGLDRDDMLKAYRILSHDDSGRRFRSLMGLPMNLRKDYVMMDIKASEALACILCSACTAKLQQQA